MNNFFRLEALQDWGMGLSIVPIGTIKHDNTPIPIVINSNVDIVFMSLYSNKLDTQNSPTYVPLHHRAFGA